MRNDESRWIEFRSQMPVTKTWAYFDHAGVSPLPAPVQQAVVEWAADMAGHGAVHWNRWRQNVETARALGAKLLNAETREIAVIHNTTEGIGFVAEGFPWKPGDNVVIVGSDFPSNRFPWMNLESRGVEVRVVPAPDERLDLDLLAKSCDAKTRIVAVSWVGYATGWRNDIDAVAEIAHRQGGYLFLDAIQGLGVLPLDVRKSNVDFLSADGHKWMLGPEGAGLFYLKSEHLDLLRPVGVGWHSVTNAGEFTDPAMTLKPAADRYEGGTHNYAGIVGFVASLKLLTDIGTDATSKRIHDVTNLLCAKLPDAGAIVASARDNNRWSGIVSFELPGHEPMALKKHCRNFGVAVNQRAGRVRASAHVYNNEDDIDKLIDALKRA
ncbi:MAG: aminotransferase class V-fold PLP-dependent enzyme [Planctomycetaceae bacterium]